MIDELRRCAKKGTSLFLLCDYKGTLQLGDLMR